MTLVSNLEVLVKLFVLILMFLVSLTAYASKPIPRRVSALEAQQKTAVIPYDVAINGGTVAPHSLHYTLPAKAIILNGVIQIVTQFSDAGSGTVALSCEDANNIKTATDITGSAAQALVALETTPIGAIAAPCDVTATVATAEQTTGKLLLFLNYVVGE